MQEEKDWEGYISRYILKYDLTHLLTDNGSKILRMDRFIVINTHGIKVALHFESPYRQKLNKICFKDLVSGTRISLSFEAEEGRYFGDGNVNLVESFLNIPLIHGWTEDTVRVDGILLRTKVFRGHSGRSHICTLHNRHGLRRWLMYRLGIGVSRASTPHKGALHRYEDRLHSVIPDKGPGIFLDFNR